VESFHPTWIEIDISRFKRNLFQIISLIKNRLFCLPVKANAYGHGLCKIGDIAEHSGVNYLGVSCLQEGIQLREYGIRIPILVFGAFQIEQIPHFIHYDLQFTLCSLYKAKEAAKFCRSTNNKCKVHVEIDTGIQRTGVCPSTAKDLINFVLYNSCFELIGIYSHFATADTPKNNAAKMQLASFETLQKEMHSNNDIIWHIANSGGLCYYPSSKKQMVRPGLLSYGYFPGPKIDQVDVVPCFTLKSRISYFKVVEKGQGISYGHSYITKKKTRIVTIPIGYGDGYRRCLSNRGHVLIRGKRYPIIGTICMDQLMVDIGNDEAYVGEEVVLIGKQKNEEIPISEIAKLCDTIDYEILCSFNERIPRIYINDKTQKNDIFQNLRAGEKDTERTNTHL